MATATLEFDAPQGLTLTVDLYAPGADSTAVTSAIATERTNDKGSYAASLVDVAPDTYRLRVRNAANVTIARGMLEHRNSAIVERPAMDDQSAIAAPTSTVVLSGTTVGTVTALATAERDSIATALLDLASAIDGKTPRQALRYIAAVLAGEIAQAGTAEEIAYGLDGSTPRVTFTVDQSGNRTGVAYD